MSLSNQKAESSFKYGKILLGTSSEGPTVVPLVELEGGSERLTWTEATTTEYKRRVRDKAAAMAKSILLEAQREARDLKKQAKAEGHREGRELAKRELDLVREDMAGTLAGYLAAFQSAHGSLWKAQRQDIVSLIQLAVEKAIHLEMSSRNREILEHLLDQAVDALDSRQRLIVRVHPGDEDNMLALLRRARERHPDLGSWRVKTDPDLHAGGLLLESDHGLVDNSVETRLAWIREVLDHLTFANVEAPEAITSLETAGILPEQAVADLPLPAIDPVEAALDAASEQIEIQEQTEAAQQAASVPQAEEEPPVAAESDATEAKTATETATETAPKTVAGTEHDEEETAPDPHAAPVHLTNQDAVDNFFESHAAAPVAPPEIAPNAAPDAAEVPESAEPAESETPETQEAQDSKAPLQGQSAVDDLFEAQAAEATQETSKTPLDGQSAVDDLFETATSSAPEPEAAPVHLASQDAVDDLFENAAAAPESAEPAEAETPETQEAQDSKAPLQGQSAVDDLFENAAVAPEAAKTPLDGQSAVDDLFEAQAASAATKAETAPAAKDSEKEDKGSLLGPDFTQVSLDGQGAVDDLFEAQAAKAKTSGDPDAEEN